MSSLGVVTRVRGGMQLMVKTLDGKTVTVSAKSTVGFVLTLVH